MGGSARVGFGICVISSLLVLPFLGCTGAAPTPSLPPNEPFESPDPGQPSTPNPGGGVPVGANGGGGGGGGDTPIDTSTPVIAGLRPLEGAFSAMGDGPQFDATLSYEWDFGDGSRSSDFDARHVYATPGVYRATLHASDASETWSYWSCDIYVIDQPDIVVDPEAPVLERPVVLRADFGAFDLSPFEPVAFHWLVDDEIVAQGASVSRVFASAKTYRIALVLVVAGMSVQCAHENLVVSDKDQLGSLPNTTTGLIADAGADQIVSGDATPARVALSAAGSSSADSAIVAYRWMSADGEVLTEGPAPIQLVDLAPGVHDIDLTITDALGRTAGDRVSITVDYTGPSLRMASTQPLAWTSSRSDAMWSLSESILVANDGLVSLDWAATVDVDWLQLSLVSGRLAGSTARSIQATLSDAAANLPDGVHVATISFDNLNNGFGGGSITLTLTLGSPSAGAFSVAPLAGLTATGVALGDNPPTAGSYTLTNSSDDVFTWTASNGADWLELTPSVGALPAGASNVVTVAFNANVLSLAPGEYTDTIAFSNSAGVVEQRLVVLTVQSTALAVSPGDEMVVGSELGATSAAQRIYTVSNTGSTPLNWTLTPTTSWVNASSLAGALAPGESEAVIVTIDDAIAGFAVGEYSTSLLFASDAGDAITRVVNLSVSPAEGAIAVSPLTPYNVSGPEGGPFDPPDFGYTLTNTSDKTVMWTAASDASWLTSSPASGELAPGANTAVTLSVGSDANVLSPDTYVGTISINHAGAKTATTLTATLSVGAVAGLLQVDPDTVPASSGLVGGTVDPAGYTFTLTNIGGQPIAWSAAAQTGWISLSNQSGTLASGGVTAVTATIDPTSLAAGVHTGRIIFTNDTSGATVVVTTGLTLSEPGDLDVSPTSAWAPAGTTGGPFALSRAYTLTNSGAAPLNWAVADDVDWLTATPGSGALNPGQSVTVSMVVNANAAALAAGAHHATLTFDQLDSDNDTTSNVSLTLTDAGTLLATPITSWNPTGVTGGPFSIARTYALTNAGDQSLNWTADSDVNWLTFTPSSGSLAGDESVTLTAAVNSNANALSAGSHVATVRFTNVGSGVVSTRQVTFTLSDPGELTVSPETTWSPSGLAGGPFSGSRTYTLSNTGDSPLSWFGGVTDNWLSMTPGSGSINAGESMTVTVSVDSDANALSAGVHHASVRFTDATTGAVVTRAVALQVDAPAALSVSPTGVWNTSGTTGGPFSLSRTYTVTNTGDQSLVWSASDNVNWLNFSPSGGTLTGGQSVNVAVSVNSNANGLSAGTHNANVTFTNSTNGVGNRTVAVALSLTDAAALSVSPTSTWNASGTTGGPFTLSRNYTLTNTGDQSLTWGVNDNVNWLNFSPSGGTLTGGQSVNVAVSVNSNANSLSAGTQNANVTFTNSTNGVGNRTLAVALSLTDAAEIQVTPTGGFSGTVQSGGTFVPQSKSYTVRNVGDHAVNYTVSKSAGWLSLNTTSGTLNPDQQTTIIVSLNSTALDQSVGSHSDTVTFTNTTNGLGNGTRTANLTVTAPAPDPADMDVTPTSTFTISGEQGGIYDADELATRDYTVTNVGDNSLSWTASDNVNWLSVSPSSGSLSGGGSATVSVTLNSNANSLSAGAHSAVLTFTNSTNGVGNVQLNVTALVSDPSGLGDPMTTASRTTGVAPLGVFFDAIDDPNESWSSSVVQPRGFDEHPTNITGVKITRVEYGTPLGAGTLTYTASSKRLTWRASGESNGASVDVSAGRLFALPSSGGLNLHVWVDPGALPSGNQSDTIVIEDGGLNADWASFHYAWDFGNPAPGGTSTTDPSYYWEHGAKKSDGSWFAKNQAFGWNAAHVYEASGTYTATLTVIDDVDGEHTYSQTITVDAEPSGGWTTYYFDATAGDDNLNTGLSAASPFRSWAKACSLVGPKVRLLFKRGETFDVTAAMGGSTSGPLFVGAYGSGVRPRFAVAGDAVFVEGGGLSDARYVDLWVDGSYPTVSNPGGGFTTPDDNSVILRCRVQDMGSGYSLTWRDSVIVQESEAVNTKKYHFWTSDSVRTAVLGCAPSEGNEEALMRCYVNKLLVSHSTFSAPSSKRTIRFHSSAASDNKAGRWYLLSYNELLDVQFSIAPDLAISPRHVVIEGNYILQPATSGPADGIIVYGADDLTIRGNTMLCEASTNFVSLTDGYNGGPYTHRNIRMTGNTFYSTSTDWCRLFNSETNTESNGYNWRITNTVFAAPNSTSSSTTSLRLRGLAIESPIFSASNNCWYTPQVSLRFHDSGGSNDFTAWRNAGHGVGAITADPKLGNPASRDFSPLGSSPCINAGVLSDAYVSRVDAEATERSAPLSIGAIE